mmetsp:Transcript_1499/g.5159  ORF Transcript_1499/g.5159 Transcript_1499/m.5159 type:complete len:269 (-) Transcript_1499:65-871(-)
MVRLAFVGAGQMAEALAKGFIAKKIVPSSHINAFDISDARRRVFREELKATVHDSNDSAVASSDVAILAVKPQYLSATAQTVTPASWENKLVLSIAAGVTIDTLKSLLPASARVVRIMPNTPCLVGESASAIATSDEATSEDEELVRRLFATVGTTISVDEGLIDAVTGLSGSGPAYIFLMIEALSDGGVRSGLPRGVATKLAAQTVMGAAKMVLETGKHPGELKDMVTSPAGTTIAGIAALEEHGARAAFIDAVTKATQRSKELSKL